VSLESRVPPEHPLRRVRALLDEALESMHRDFERVYASGGRSSVSYTHLDVYKRQIRICGVLKVLKPIAVADITNCVIVP